MVRGLNRIGDRRFAPLKIVLPGFDHLLAVVQVMLAGVHAVGAAGALGTVNLQHPPARTVILLIGLVLRLLRYGCALVVGMGRFSCKLSRSLLLAGLRMPGKSIVFYFYLLVLASVFKGM